MTEAVEVVVGVDSLTGDEVVAEVSHAQGCMFLVEFGFSFFFILFLSQAEDEAVSVIVEGEVVVGAVEVRLICPLSSPFSRLLNFSLPSCCFRLVPWRGKSSIWRFLSWNKSRLEDIF